MAAKLEKTRTPGIYKRGSRYVHIWTHRGRQHKESFRTEAEAREAKGRRQAGEKRPVSKIGFEEYFSTWIETYAGRTSRGFSETTRPEYKRPIEAHAIGEWKTWKLAEIEPTDVRDLFGKLRREGASTSAIRKLRAALSALFATAVDDGLIRSNPVQGVRIPPALGGEEEPEDEKAKALTKSEYAMLRAEIPEDWHLFFDFLVQTGLRIGEAIGLTWEHVSLGDSPRIEVREQVYRGKRRKLKSRAARRDLPLSRAMAARLLIQRRDHYAGPTSPVFPSKTGTPLIPGKVRERVLWPAAIAVGLTEEVETDDGEIRAKAAVGFHALRHTCASLLFEQGRNIKQVSVWLGHSDPAFTLRTYVHLMDDGVGDAEFFVTALESGNGVAREDTETSENAEVAELVETLD